MDNKVRVKICGITNIDDAMKAVSCGASALGFIFHKKSPRYISPSKARRIVEQIPPFVTPVGVFVDLKEKPMDQICRFTNIRTIQFHGDETPAFCKRFKQYKLIKAFRVSDDFDFSVVKEYKVDALLFDAHAEGQYGGSGQTFNWTLLKRNRPYRPMILAGGITPQNVRAAIEEVKPFAVDVSSGVEKAPGQKDHRALQELFDAINFTVPAQPV